MKARWLSFACSLGFGLSGLVPGAASAISFDISWTGANGYSMTGMFSYDDSLIGTGAIDETDIDSLMIEGFLSGSSIGSWSLPAVTPTGFNFNFDTNTQTFIIGGTSTGTSGQRWNVETGASGLGFNSGNPNQALALDGVYFTDSIIKTAVSTLTATPSAVPVPAALYLFGSGLIGLAAVARRKAS